MTAGLGALSLGVTAAGAGIDGSLFPGFTALALATLLVFFQLGRVSPKLAAGWVACASLFFYGWWSPGYVALLLGSVDLLLLPYGTALGVYALYVLLNENSKALFVLRNAD